MLDPSKGIEAAVEIRSDQNFINPETAPANPIFDISPLDNGGFKVSIVTKVQAKNLHQ